MKLVVDKPILGYINRGMENERILTHASPGDKVDVVFDNTQKQEGKTVGHYICVPQGTSSEEIIEEHLDFIVFPSQVFSVIESKRERSERNDDYYYTDHFKKDEDDPFSTLLSEDDDESLLEGHNN